MDAARCFGRSDLAGHPLGLVDTVIDSAGLDELTVRRVASHLIVRGLAGDLALDEAARFNAGLRAVAAKCEGPARFDPGPGYDGEGRGLLAALTLALASQRTREAGR